MSVSTEDYNSVKGLPADLTASVIRDRLVEALDKADHYVRSAPADIVGLLAVDVNGRPAQISSLNESGVQFRKATSERELMPSLPDVPEEWRGIGHVE
ncbi:hypothetical protein [Rhizobium leucaenae]|uniref:Uncharacterized protein n=1 Tax=Rhizobium leucaenae TaxID=29450 RepID=A0A7W6ZW55_9HYPH|nr:hypothetical protein [Rhizobium leucaenae]MBB4569844.1 hypothetical protein [Rhizobium leucaenae]MBB6299643.1 hypothetical protein [Rhizobium leucaenae]